MAFTRAQIETLLVRRCGKRLALVGLDGATADGTNADLADPIRAGLASVGVDAADPTDPTDADLAAVASADLPQLLDVAELRALESALGNWDLCDEQAGTDKQDWAKVGELLQKQIQALRDQLRDLYGLGAPGLSIGLVDLNFAESGDPCDEQIWQDF